MRDDRSGPVPDAAGEGSGRAGADEGCDRVHEADVRAGPAAYCAGGVELHVFNELHAAAVEVAGEPLSAFLGNDYACGRAGGRRATRGLRRAGEIYILDLGPAYRGYFSDNCRGICVNGKPTDPQMKANELVTSCAQAC